MSNITTHKRLLLVRHKDIKKIVNHRANWIRHQKETSDFNVEPSQISSKLRVQVPWPSSSAKLVPP